MTSNKEQAIGTYSFTVVLNPESNLLEAFLLDTRDGSVYSGGFDKTEGDIIWKRYVSPKFKE